MKRPRRFVAGLLLVSVAVSCTPHHHSIEPYVSNPEAARALEARATQACDRPANTMPPHPFTTDGCSAFPDDGWVECCIEHDFQYWCGGSASDRSRADDELLQCVSRARSAALGRLMWAGVRVGGIPWSPAPWRWAYGWDWFHGYDERR